MNNLMRTSTVLGLMAALAAAGCQSGDTASETPPAPPPGESTSEGGYGGPTGVPPVGAGPAQPSLSVTQMGGGKPGKGPKTSFDGSPDPNAVAPGGGQQMPDPSGGAGGAGGATGAAKPKPIRPGMMAAKFRSDPFVSFIQFVIEKPPAYSLAVPDRLAAPPKIELPPDTQRPEDLLPLPQVPRRVAGVLYNGAITAILETGEPPNSETAVISPGAKVPSGVPGIPDLTVDSIAMDRLVLRAEDGRTVEVKLSALPPSVQDSLRQQFGSGGAAGGGFAGGGGPSFGGSGPGGFGAPGGFGGGGAPRGGRGGAMMGGGGGAGLQ